MRERFQHREAASENVLLVMYPDGWVEVFSHSGVRIHFWNLHPYAKTADTERRAWELLDLSLPSRLKRYTNSHAFRGVPGLVNFCQVRLSVYEGRPVYQWLSGNDKWPPSNGDDGIFCRDTMDVSGG